MLAESSISADQVHEQVGRRTVAIEDRGYAIAPFLTQAEMDALLEVHHTVTPVVPMDYYPTGFARAETRRRIYQGIMEIIGHRVEELAPGYRPLMASFVTKKAHSTKGRLALHQDYSLVDHRTHLGLNVWAPLCDVDDRNGCMRMVDYSHRFGHISAMPPNPGAYSNLYDELEANYLTSVPMTAGTACIFDTRILHATEENVTERDRTAVVLNLVPVDAKPRLHFWNAAIPARLEAYTIDTEFAMNMTVNTYPDEAARVGATFVEFVDYDPAPWSLEELRQRIPQAVGQATFSRPVNSAPAYSSSSVQPPNPTPQVEPAVIAQEKSSPTRLAPRRSWWRTVFSFGSPQ